MPAGDAERVWFPEMLSRLEEVDFAWNNWASVTAFCDAMMTYRSELRKAKGIKDPLTRCPACHTISRMRLRGISVRSFLFAIAKSDLISEVELTRLDRQWQQHRKANKLDKFGRTAKPKLLEEHCCS